ncbi:hypothetical protein [Novipirellula sp.]|uniref:hypothetical protein n=1 Tax=Novipirellula sp. TaxID=2795430 RepID=UPI003562188A
MKLNNQQFVERIRAIAHDGDTKPSLDGEGELDDRLSVALNFMADQLAGRNVSDSLDHDLAALVHLVVPDFADACKIDLFEQGGGIRRFAKYACDDLLLEPTLPTAHGRADRPSCIKIALSDGISFLGAIEFQRLPTQRPFTMDEHLDAKVLASRISKRVVGITPTRYSGAIYRN